MEKLQGYKINNQFFDEPLDLGEISLIQIGRYFCLGGTVIREHLHKNFIELTIVNEGKGIIRCNGKEIEVEKNDIFVSFPFDTHSIISDNDMPIQYDHLAFTANDDEYGSIIQEIIAEYYDTQYRVIQDSRINYLTYCILGEFNKDRKRKHELTKNTILNIIIYLARAFDKKESSNSLEHANEKERLCNRIMNYIDTNIYSIERLQDIASVAGYNYNYLSTIFASTMGITLREYFFNRKLEVAQMLIREEKLKICEIAEKLHYSDSNALARAYKQKYGISPKETNKGRAQ